VTIRLNGEPCDLPGPLPISALLEHLHLDPRRVAVEHDRVVVKRAEYGRTMIAEGAEVEIVAFVGGGRH
jgi:thiamine biosynthesis protein ThiS